MLGAHSRSWGLSPGPFSAIMLTTDRCSAQCDYCVSYCLDEMPVAAQVARIALKLSLILTAPDHGDVASQHCDCALLAPLFLSVLLENFDTTASLPRRSGQVCRLGSLSRRKALSEPLKVTGQQSMMLCDARGRRRRAFSEAERMGLELRLATPWLL